MINLYINSILNIVIFFTSIQIFITIFIFFFKNTSIEINYYYNINIIIYILFFIISFFKNIDKDLIIQKYYFCFLIFLYIMYFLIIKQWFDKILKKEIIVGINCFFLSNILLLSTTYWIVFFLALEFLSFCLIFLINTSNKKMQTEVGIRYFLINSVSSIFILIGIWVVIYLTGNYSFELININLLIQKHSYLTYFGFFSFFLGLCLKFGIGPFWIWYYSIYAYMENYLFFFFTIIAKYTYLYIINNFIFYYMNTILNNYIIFNIIFIYLILTIIFCMFFVFYQTTIQGFITITSIIQNSLLILLIINGFQVGFFIYLFFYILNLLLLFLILYSRLIWVVEFDNELIKKIIDLRKIANSTKIWYWLLLIVFFNFAGIPPLIGFFIKYVILVKTVYEGIFFITFFFIFCSIFFFIYYIRIILILKNLSNKDSILFKNITKRNFLLIIIISLCLIFFIIKTIVG